MMPGLLRLPSASTEDPSSSTCTELETAFDTSSAHPLTVDADFWSAYDEERTLGRGCFGTVVLVRPRANHPSDEQRPLAVKVIMDDIATALHEAAILRSLSHPNLISLHGVYASPSTVFVLMHAELGGDLMQRAEAAPGGVLSEAEALGPMCGVLAALRFLHTQHGIVHRDVKASNVLLASDGVTAKLGDFGLAARLPASGRLTSVCGTHDFLAPEMIRTGHGECAGYGCAVDMWAVGLMLHALLLGANPFERETDIETLQAILAGEYAPPADTRLSGAVRHLLAALLVPEPAQRLTSEQAASHTWATPPPASAPANNGRRASRLISRLWARAG